MKKIYLKELISVIPKSINFSVKGIIEGVFVTNTLPIMSANENSISFIDKTRSELEKNLWASETKSKLIITDLDIDIANKTNIVTAHPKLLFSFLVNEFFVSKKKKEIHSSAIISDKAIIGKNCFIGPNTLIGAHVKIGNNCDIYGNVTIYENVKIGDNVKINSGTVIGAEGFGYLKSESLGTINFPHLGGVIIEDNVEIGANTTIDRGALGNTILKKNVKVDNLVHIAHNVYIDEGAWIIAKAMVAGSVKIGKNTSIAPGACIRDAINIGNNVLIGMGAVVTKSVPDNQTWTGVPARELKDYFRIQKELKKFLE
ncbi:UDP-3-O-(3-hydroxymyristoyl)glucosamine N-acyltransferase [Aquimarina megaterium]|uniref:UDP-3-O-(3-hydroxymyristoyl)glucosamine N-acyltransferase n=1 Tax=Aquimarina megaterium TaxID=1443666 RepID=UPI000472642A|nr:UDP-3-O-(3-hydroxymyristoyl)glucosamine N-acyltransferase [Aquimarina megaterium]